MIVPYAAQAHLLYEKVGCAEFSDKPFEIINRPPLAQLVHNKVVPKDKIIAAGRKGGLASGLARHRPYLGDNKERELSVARNAVSRYKKRIEECKALSQNYKKWEDKLKAAKSKIDELLK